MRLRIVKVAAVAVVAVLAAACTPSQSQDPVGQPGAEASGDLELWHFFSDREEKALNEILDDFRAKHPKVKLVAKGGQDDGKTTQAIGAGSGPDVAISYSTDIVGSFCNTSAWNDLTPYVERDKIDMGKFPAVVKSYTEFRGKRCAMPFLADAYGLYYNKAIFSEAGVTAPPKTLTELSELAKKLTKRKPDGSLERVGFLPLFGFYENSPGHLAPLTGATWLKSDGTSNIGSDPKWQQLIKWQKELVDWYGHEQLEAFRAGLGDEWSAENAFHTGQVAMNIDGEWRLAFLRDQAKDVQFGVAPLPVDDAARYGSGYVGGSVIGVSRTSKNAEATWALVRYLTTDTGAIVKLSNGIRNLPTTTDALNSKDLVVDEQFKVFLDIFAHPATQTTPPSAVGPAYQDELSKFLQEYQSGAQTDLAGGLTGVDTQVNNLLKLAG